MSREPDLFLRYILECTEKTISYTAGMTIAEFSEDGKTIAAVLRNLAIIGEAVKNVPPPILNTKPEIDWKQIARLRVLVVHHYFKIKLTVVWDIVQKRFTGLQKVVTEF